MNSLSGAAARLPPLLRCIGSCRSVFAFPAKLRYCCPADQRCSASQRTIQLSETASRALPCTGTCLPREPILAST